MRTGVMMLLGVLFAFVVRGQSDPGTLEVNFTPYTSLRTHYAILDGESEFQDNASRLGINLNIGRSSRFKFIAQVELSIRLIESTFELNADSRTTSGFIIFNSSQEGQVFGARLGYIGLDLGPYGRITIGKQWSTYYDVSGFTDRFNVFGGTTSNTYVAGTDGGIGTGRSDQAFIYRLNPGKWHFGVQLLFNSTINDTFVDGYGGVLRYDLTPALSLGAAYQHSILANSTIQGTLGLEADPQYFCAGITFDNNTFFLSGVYAVQTNGDLTVGVLDNEELPSVVFNDSGLELVGGYRLGGWRVLAGANMEWADTDNLPIDPDFQTENYILGLEYHPNKLAYFYGELRIDEGVDARGNEAFDVFTLGLRIDLSHHGRKEVLLKAR